MLIYQRVWKIKNVRNHPQGNIRKKPSASLLFSKSSKSQVALAFNKWLHHAVFIRHHLQNRSEVWHLFVVLRLSQLRYRSYSDFVLWALLGEKGISIIGHYYVYIIIHTKMNQVACNKTQKYILLYQQHIIPNQLEGWSLLMNNLGLPRLRRTMIFCLGWDELLVANHNPFLFQDIFDQLLRLETLW